jgi:hypothetical protein
MTANYCPLSIAESLGGDTTVPPEALTRPIRESGNRFQYDIAITAIISPRLRLSNAVTMAWIGAAIDATSALFFSRCCNIWRRRGCPAWPLHANSMLWNWMITSYIPRKASGRDSQIHVLSSIFTFLPCGPFHWAVLPRTLSIQMSSFPPADDALRRNLHRMTAAKPSGVLSCG